VTSRRDEGLIEAVEAVMRRARGYCEVNGPDCQTWAVTAHHRLRGLRVHLEDLMLAVCSRCHTEGPKAIHTNERWAHAHGLLLRRGIEPFLVLGHPLDCREDHTPGRAMPSSGILFSRRGK
jgi:hypothetical protein